MAKISPWSPNLQYLESRHGSRGSKKVGEPWPIAYIMNHNLKVYKYFTQGRERLFLKDLLSPVEIK